MKTYTIRPLAWEKSSDGTERAAAVGGTLTLEPGFGTWSIWLEGHFVFEERTPDAAKLAAQRWHDARLLPALREVPEPKYTVHRFESTNGSGSPPANLIVGKENP